MHVMNEKPQALPPSKQLDQFVVRLPNGLRDRIRVTAEANNRSMNSEIVSTLEKAYPEPDPFKAYYEVLLETHKKMKESNDRQQVERLLRELQNEGLELLQAIHRESMTPQQREQEDREKADFEAVLKQHLEESRKAKEA